MKLPIFREVDLGIEIIVYTLDRQLIQYTSQKVAGGVKIFPLSALRSL
jgi:hypothetical protein